MSLVKIPTWLKGLFFLLPLAVFAEKPFKQFHDATYKFGYDIHFSPYAGGEDILFTHRALERAEGYLIHLSPIYCSQRASDRFWRACEISLGWLPVNYLAVAVQHEVFGHAYRIRDINRGRAEVAGFSFNTPPPYGYGGAATEYYISTSLTTTEDSSIAMAGVESTAILAQLTKLKWLESHRIDPRQVALYLLSQHDLNLYIGSLDVENDTIMDGHDIQSYIRSVNETYTHGKLSAKELKALSWINLADPFSFYSAYAWLRYIATGKETRIPMIPLFDWKYLPTIRLGLTPFGPEFFLENYLLKERSPIYFYLKGGNHSQNQYLGCGFYAPKLWRLKNWLIGLRMDAWRQPKLLLEEREPNQNPLYPYSEQESKKIGGAASFILAYQNESGFEVELGYKSIGFLPGYSLRAAPTARLFYTLLF